MFKQIQNQKGLSFILIVISIFIVLVLSGIIYITQFKNTTPKSETSLPKDTKKSVSTKSEKSVITLLDNKISVKATDFVEGKAAPCQPDFFDPKTSKFQKVVETSGTPSELYQIQGENYPTMMIDGWYKEGDQKVHLNPPYNLTTYHFGCASSLSFVLNLTKNNQRQSLFTHVDYWSISDDKNYLFLINNLKNTVGKYQLLKRIINIESNSKIALPNFDCTDDGMWSGDKLVTYSDKNKQSSDEGYQNYQTKVCIWDKEGNILYKLRGNLDWYGASIDILWSKIGLLPKDQNIFYTYKTDFQTEPQNCKLYFQDLTNQNRWKEINLFTKANQDPKWGPICPNNIEFDLSNVKLNAGNLRYKIEEGRWQIVNYN